PAGAGALDVYVHTLEPVLQGAAGRLLCRHLGGERRALLRPLEADGAGAGPGDHLALRIGDRDNRVVERGLDVNHTLQDVPLLLGLAAGVLTLLFCHRLLALLPADTDRALRPLPGARVRTGSLAP